MGVNKKCKCALGVKWLASHLPHPFRGPNDIGFAIYADAIDKGRGKEVAQAIESLIPIVTAFNDQDKIRALKGDDYPTPILDAMIESWQEVEQ